jgi:hypothetical protein
MSRTLPTMPSPTAPTPVTAWGPGSPDRPGNPDNTGRVVRVKKRRNGVVFARVAAMRRQLASSLTNEMALLIHGSAADFIVNADIIFTPHSPLRTGWDVLMIVLTLYCCFQVSGAARRRRRRWARHSSARDTRPGRYHGSQRSRRSRAARGSCWRS